MLALYSIFFFFKQKTAYEMRISDWSSDVCSSDLSGGTGQFRGGLGQDICFVSVHSKPMSIVFLTERLKVPAPGIGGGSHGALGAVLINGAAIDSGSTQVLMPGAEVKLRTQGGGGSGPQDRKGHG